ncbi:MAG TPA: hypothetical protein VK007_08785 [Acidimicrobiales bacterium]|nr:hypothetical protein [Acidimicrobiales bacterium]
MSIRGRPRTVALAPLLVLALGAGCGDDDSADPTTSTTAATTTTEDAAAAEEAAVLAAYEAHWAGFVAAIDPPDPDAEALAEHTGGKALEDIQTVVRRYEAEGVAARGDYELNPRVVHVGATRATLEDCVIDDLELYLVHSDEVVEPAEGKPVGFRAELTLEDDTWRVTKLDAAQEVCPQ